MTVVNGRLSTRKMTQRYERRNLEGFEGDTVMKERVKKLIRDFQINTVIELGTYIGGTARQFAFMVPEVITVEINQVFFLRSKDQLRQYRNVQQIHDDSVSALPQILQGIAGRGMKTNLLFFIDSHWESNNPLLAELEIIADFGLRPVIAIHDFKVPDHPELGFDTYGEIIYEWKWIKKSVEKIYGKHGFEIEYNDKAEGAKRGIIYITPK